MQIQFLGATQEVTGSCYLIKFNKYQILVECGLIQGSFKDNHKNNDPFYFNPKKIDAVFLSHAHLDHSGRLPLLFKRGYTGQVYTHSATADLCEVMLKDAGYLNEREAFWENKKRQRKGLPLVKPLFDQKEAHDACMHFKRVNYHEKAEILPGLSIQFEDAGHILGSSIIVFKITEKNDTKTIVFSGDLGHKGAPILNDPTHIKDADLVIMESTYGDRTHRSWEDTWQEMGEIFKSAQAEQGNILIPAFTIGRTQELLYALKANYDEWNIADWSIFLDSPMGITATEIYATHDNLFDKDSSLITTQKKIFNLPNLHLSRSTDFSMKINQIVSGAIIIAGSGMCTGGRIKHHLKHNIWRDKTQLIIAGFQAKGTLGRKLVDGAKFIRLWGETVKAPSGSTPGSLVTVIRARTRTNSRRSGRPHSSIKLVKPSSGFRVMSGTSASSDG